MSLLLDTHTAVWYALGDGRLSSAARQAIEDEPDLVYVSPASYWELAIKISVGKFTLVKPFDEFWQHAIADEGLTVLHIEPRHCHRLIALPHLHRDPFDRLLVAQALVDDLSLVSNDATLDGYQVTRIW